MRKVSRIGATLLQIAAFGVFLNAAAAYGDCAMPMQDEGEHTEKQRPCHPVSQNEEIVATDIEVEDCCAACIAVAIPPSDSEPTRLPTNFAAAREGADIPSFGFDPPFRPPAVSLS